MVARGGVVHASVVITRSRNGLRAFGGGGGDTVFGGTDRVEVEAKVALGGAARAPGGRAAEQLATPMIDATPAIDVIDAIAASIAFTGPIVRRPLAARDGEVCYARAP